MERRRTLLVMNQIRDSKWLPGSLVLLTLTIGIVIGTLISSDVGAARKQPVAPDATPLLIPKAIPIENEFSAIAKRVRPAVVNIQVEFQEKSSRAPSKGNSREDFFRRFFGMPENPFGGQMPRERQRRRPGEGSGVIVDPKGYVITNNHVVGGADRIRVRLFDDDTKLYEANIIGVDAETDIAVLKIEISREVPFAAIGNSETVDVGDWAIAVGSPFGYRETVTVGIISAKSREVAAGRPRPFQKFLQTDAAINPGNSGGPLLNIRGEVIGINTAIVSNSGSFQGLGFALPSNDAARVYNQIIQHGKVARGSIGIEFQSNQSPALLRTFGAPDGGVLVGRVKPGGPADRGGVQKEDVIIKIGNQPVKNGDQLIAIISETPVGSSISVVVVRNGKHVNLDVEIEDRAELFSERAGVSQQPKGARGSETEVILGFSVKDLNQETRDRIGYRDLEGVLVTKVTPASFADDIGLLRNDIIVGINRKKVQRVSDIEKIQDDLKPGSDVAVKIARLAGHDNWATHYLAGVLQKTETE
ncbi:MAG: peptidase S1 [Solibacterales bacterium]|nr:peptidase S1 [Bryobacterales bacterium]